MYTLQTSKPPLDSQAQSTSLFTSAASNQMDRKKGNLRESQCWMHGWRLGWTGGVPRKFEGGRRPMHPSPNISRNTVIGCEAKYEVTKKVLQQEFRVGKYPHFVKFFVKTGSNRQT